MNAYEIAEALLNSPPSWMRPKPCAVCGAEFVPADPRQECCPPHHRALVMSVRDSFDGDGVQNG